MCQQTLCSVWTVVDVVCGGITKAYSRIRQSLEDTSARVASLEIDLM